ncbi:SDR family NAD(P)-dependent oxidoreductase [Listeria grayi]|uniref:Oxidoreductase, short chain dehydrogenase/reductase family protein n=2 Tax=Listeria grayi TaxID=1641 RepID=D7V0B8_LISGR|nr:SDR family NAD(P)-dependent oxidoreductase [Listeria grayi]EFI83011.1 oxidoreductase, short chain dehydrogenase/reductase family protein [Listeria grayi DSM 20601]STY43988.1 3-oxoacyl-[acyl-carrier-protein] reductase FabG [Listeria grayi]
MQPFKDKIAFITGGGSGMGAATAKLLAERGAKVAIFGRRKEKLDQVVFEIEAAGGIAIAIPGDVSIPSDLEKAIKTVVDNFGTLHYAVNNAGMRGYKEKIANMTIEQWDQVIRVNLSSLFYSMKYEIPEILKAGGAIVNISSVFADRGGPTPDYSSAKHAIRGLTRTATIDYGAQGSRVNELQPGVIDTEMTQADLKGTEAVAKTGIPLKRISQGEEIAKAVAFLLSEEASYITGASLAVDGGFLA